MQMAPFYHYYHISSANTVDQLIASRIWGRPLPRAMALDGNFYSFLTRRVVDFLIHNDLEALSLGGRGVDRKMAHYMQQKVSALEKIEVFSFQGRLFITWIPKVLLLLPVSNSIRELELYDMSFSISQILGLEKSFQYKHLARFSMGNLIATEQRDLARLFGRFRRIGFIEFNNHSFTMVEIFSLGCAIRASTVF